MACTWRRILRTCPASRRRSGERPAAAPVEDSRGRRPGGQRAAPAGVLASAGYTAVETVIDPGLVVARCTEEPPDLLLLDWHMPGRSGAGILEDIAFLTEEPNWMPVLVLTVDIAPDTKRQALSLGARDFLTKPIDVTEVLRARAQPAADPLSPRRARAQQRPPARARLAAHARARGREARDARPSGARRRVPRRRDRPARRADRPHERAARARPGARRTRGDAHRPGRAAARHRQDRHRRRAAAEARQVHRRGVPGHETRTPRSARASSRAAPTSC